MNEQEKQDKRIQENITIDTPYDENLDRIMADALGRCIRENPNFMLDKCESEFNKRIFPLLEERRSKNKELAGYLKSCLDSKQKAQQCAAKGLKAVGGSQLNVNNDNIKARQLLK